MRRFSFAAALGGICAGLLGQSALAPSAMAKDQPRPAAQQRLSAVLELYTSQGCSSCPPADALLGQYTGRSDVIALTFHVDIWDYLGWRDTLAHAKFTARQKYYAKHRGDGRVYTPQIVVNGLMHAVGSSAREIDKAIAKTAPDLARGIPVAVKIEGRHIVIDVPATAPGIEAKDATIWLAMIQNVAEVSVRGGENRGKALKYFNVVRDITPIGMWSGKPLNIRLDIDTVKLPETDRAAVIVQIGKAGPIVGAAMIPGL